MSRPKKRQFHANLWSPQRVGSQITGRETKSSQAEVRPHNRWLPWAICFSLATAVWVVFGQTLAYDFVGYDDNVYVYANPVVRGGVSFSGIAWIFTHFQISGDWLPLAALSHMVDWQFYGANAGGHHLTNVLLHGATAMLLFLVLRKMTGALWWSAFVAAVFAIHPLRVESVAWVTERKDVLSGLFFMLTLWAYARHVQKQSSVEAGISPKGSAWVPFNSRQWTTDYFWALVFFALGLLAKSMLVTLPFILLILDYWPLRRVSFVASENSGRCLFRAWVGLILEKVPFFLLSGAACAVTMQSQKEAISAVQGLTLFWRVGNALTAYVDYVWQMLYPVGLAVLYPHPENHLPLWKAGLSALILLLVSAGVMAKRRTHPYLLAGWLWYLGMLVPVIGFIRVGEQARADRYTYLPQIGLYLLVTWGMGALSNRWHHQRVVLGTAAGAVLASLLVAAHVQTGYWKNTITLWTHTLACTSENAVAHEKLGLALSDEGKTDEAVQQYAQALAIRPNFAEAHSNFGNALVAQGHVPEAIEHYEQAIQLKPDYSDAHVNLANALFMQGHLDDAIAHYRQALQVNPDFAEAHYNLGYALASEGMITEAMEHYRRALQLKPDYAEAYYSLGYALAGQGNLSEAIENYNVAIQLKPGEPAFETNLGIALARQGKLDEAIQHYQRALQLDPDNFDAYNSLGIALDKQGKVDEAIQQFEQAIRLKPDDAESLNNLGAVLAMKGDVAEAISRFEQALTQAIAQGDTALANAIRARIKACEETSAQQRN